MSVSGGSRFGLRWLLRSLAGRLVLVTLVFFALPVLIYEQFRQADQERQVLLLRSAQQQGQLIARAIEPMLPTADGPGLARLGPVVDRFADDNTRVRLLLRPKSVTSTGGEGFFYVASAPAVPTAMLDLERQRLIEQGVLVRLAASCAGDQPLAIPVPTERGGLDLLTSIVPIRSPIGCWAVVTSHAAAPYLGTHPGRPYWRAPEVQAASLIYVALAALVLILLTEVWRNIRRFGDLARDIVLNRGPAGSFAARNTVPELAPVAEDFDRLVATLHNSAANLRRAAEDNAHAFKTPIAVIRQAVEPLKRIVPPDDQRGRRAIDMIEGSIERLDGLVSFARRMDETAADLLEPPRQRVDLSALIERVLQGYRGLLETREVSIMPRIEADVAVRAGEELLETVVENVIDNAIGFSPPFGVIRVALRREGQVVLLTVEDEGPGVDPANLDRIFERYFSQRGPTVLSPPVQGDRAVGAVRMVPNPDGMPHYGIGLWIVRRNLEAVGGRVDAFNRETGGLCVRMQLPAA